MDLANPQNFSSAPTPAPQPRGGVNQWLLIVIVVLLIIICGILGYFYMGGLFNQNYGFSQNNHSINQNNIQEPTSTNDKNGTASTTTLAISWQNPEKISDVKLFLSDMPAFDSSTYYTSSANYYLVGKVKNGPGEIIMASVAYDGPGGPAYVMLKRVNNTLTLLSNYSQAGGGTPQNVTNSPYGQIDGDGMLLRNYTVDNDTHIADLDFPQTITGPQPRQNLVLDHVRGFDASSLYIIQSNEQFTPAFTDSVWGQVYTATSTNGFYLLKGPLVAIYNFKPDFFDKDLLLPDITFTSGVKNSAEYTYTTRGGCGSSNYMQVVSPNSVSIANDLIVVGKNSKGDNIYALKNTKHELLKAMYEAYPTDPQQSYDKYLSTHPILFWVDPFGRLVQMQNAKYQPQAECGKPVIYLYPQTTITTSVKVMPKAGLTFSDPAYKNGWNVWAEPSGQLTEIGTGRHYPYLYWEGRGNIYEQPKEGWVVTKQAVPAFLKQKLLQLGLNHDEEVDFMDFWLPRMQAKPYYFITFLGNRTMNEIAPLTIDPMPDTVIRILMDFSPLDKPITVKPYNIYTPVRRGYTVVEWGGVLR